MDFVFQVDVAGVLNSDEGLEDFAYGHDAGADGHLAFFAVSLCEVFHVDVEEARANLLDSVNYVCAGAHGVAHVNAAAHAGVHVFDGFEHGER